MRYVFGLRSACSAGRGRLAADEKPNRAAVEVRKLGGQVTLDEDQPGKPVVNVDLTRCAGRRR